MGLLKTAFAVMPAPLRRQAMHRLERHIRKRRLGEINTIARSATAGSVCSGPFAGLVFPDDIGYPRYNIAPKLFGTYEQDLAGPVERMVQRTPSSVVIAGSAEGYYAVGLARRLSGTPIVAFDILEQCNADTLAMASANNVEVSVLGRCTLDDLNRYLTPGGAVVMDVEGQEIGLLDLEKVPLLRTADIIVESHDRLTITPVLADRFAATHTVEIIEEGDRPSVPHPALTHLDSVQRSMAVCEFRGPAMQWLYLEAIERS